ncbi:MULTISPECIES: DNA-processing protein DprA [Petrimonas]|jgi:DNA processing protein|uniref:Protein smf n=1 Tax=Petrimonas mucosa TaxID=1642646 RepID=A0A1G4G9V2_9BACT|nr:MULTISPECIES: DNA-processing protein DprA [Petrimonas]MDD3559954.1 DNA-processing protein DprA [Petrimonas mucosa]SCM59271.1 Protein smf [Petrimonas mucosa]SFU44211.1 DNA processing protein [Porphyromonadaceae bacterium KHP3R9]HHT29292.1 DNA-protecting protein DprA [Petrimonas mucosa]
MIADKTLYQIALTFIPGVGAVHARNLINAVGDEEALFHEKRSNLKKIPGLSHRLIDEILNPEVLRRAEKELQFIDKHGIKVLFYTQEDYPSRLTNCIDAPVLLYCKGEVSYNLPKVVSVVGTRNASRYGLEWCRQFVGELSLLFPDILIVSGLAYGIDICAHRTAVENRVATVAVLAHGLDRIYPALHRKTAEEMLERGGWVTEFPSDTEPDRYNFVKRNRIVAGMADAVVVVESGEKGGSIITAEIANSYFREVFAVPGRTTDARSTGCNTLIATNRALLLQNSAAFINQMGWDGDTKAKQPLQMELFPELNETEEKVFQLLSKVESMHVNMLSIELNLPVSDLFFTLLELEMKKVVRALPGGVYKLI